jgi:twitching motility protein PilT
MTADAALQKPRISRDQLVLKRLVFEDVYISTSGQAEFVSYDGQTTPAPTTAAGERLDPGPEIAFLLPFLQEQAKTRDEFALLHDGVRYRVSVIRAQAQPWFVLRRAARDVPALDSFEGVQILEAPLLDAVSRPGLVIATGQTGAGKTTFLSALLRHALERHGGVAVTIEDPPELRLEGKYPKGRCFQLSVPEPDFPVGLRRALRHRPRYILVGEIRSQPAAMAALQASVTGHAVLTTVHGGSVTQALMNLVAMAAPNGRTEMAWQRLAETLQAVIYLQRNPDRKAPRAQMLLLPGAASEDAIRARIRTGHLEGLRDEMEQTMARARRGMLPGLTGRNGPALLRPSTQMPR